MFLRSPFICLLAFFLHARAQADNYNVTNTNDSGAGSLRQAILNANAHPNIDVATPDTISFAIPGGGLHTITPLTELPAISDAVVLDGYTQPGASANTLALGDDAVILVEINGDGASFNGLTIAAGSTTVRGLVIGNFNRNGVVIDSGANANTIQGNFIGVSADGGELLNYGYAIEIAHSDNNLIGGSATAARNIIVSQGTGILISGEWPEAGGQNNTIEGNYIGTNAAGTAIVPAGGGGGSGIMLFSASYSSVVGNVIAGFGSGISLSGSIAVGAYNNRIQGNFIGTDVAGQAALPNGAGIAIWSGARPLDPISSNNLIGGTDPGTRNLISGNRDWGIYIFGGNQNTVQGNYIGIAGDGSSPLPNGLGGIQIGKASIREGTGVGNVVGGPAPGAGNVIAYNGVRDISRASGIDIYSGTENTVLGNSIFGNHGLGIDLGYPEGPTPNDLGDTDMGANYLQNFPVITSVRVNGSDTIIEGTLNSVAGTTFRIEVFANGDRAQSFLGSTDVTTDANGDASFNLVVPQLAANQRVSATATDPGGNTSEFSPLIGRLSNISTRLRVRTGDNVLIGGFIISGADPKRILVRAIGPSLSPFGIPDPLQDPVLELHDGSGATLAINDNWRIRPDGSSQQAEIEATGIPPTNDLESALVRTLPANNAGYTAILRGKDNTIGIGVVEAYDLDGAANSTLGNISTRGFVETGNDVLIGGFIAGNGIAKVVIRAIGPTLANAGVPNALQDPTLTLYNESGTPIATNDDWKTKPDGSSQQAEIEATGLAPTNDRESAIAGSLPPSNYTAIVRGKDNTAGVALVEVYYVQ